MVSQDNMSVGLIKCGKSGEGDGGGFVELTTGVESVKEVHGEESGRDFLYGHCSNIRRCVLFVCVLVLYYDCFQSSL